jgi:hypothetical protein
MSADLLQSVISKLAASPKPLGYADLKKELVRKKSGISEEMLRTTLESAVNSGQVFRWGDYARKKRCYWTTSREAFFDGAILRACTERALASSEIRIPGLATKILPLRIQELVRDHRLKAFPGIGSEKARLGVSPQSYAAALREFVKAKLNKAGIQEDVLFGSGAPVESAEGLEDRIVDALRKLQSAPDVPVASVLLREELKVGDANKAAFDQGLLRLRDQKRVYLSRHHNPHELPAAERNQLIDGGDGSYYVAANLRMDV